MMARKVEEEGKRGGDGGLAFAAPGGASRWDASRVWAWS